MKQPINLHGEHVYEITVKGEINMSWLMGFNVVYVQTVNLVGEHQFTRSKIVADQAGVVGLIRRLHGLGVVFVSVQLAPDPELVTLDE